MSNPHGIIPVHRTLSTACQKLNLTSSQKLFVSEKQSQILHQILVTYIIEDKDVSLGLFFKKEEI